LVLGIALAALVSLPWATAPRRGAVPAPVPSAAVTAPAPAPALRIVLRLAPGAPTENAWLLGALRGVLRTGLHGNPDLQVESALDGGESADGPRLSGTVALDRLDSVPREVRIDWRLTGFDGRPRRWRDSAPADRLFDIADRVQARLRAADPRLASIGAGAFSGPIPVGAQRRFARGAEAKSAHRHAEAAAEFEAALPVHPGFLLARIALADALIEQGYRAAAAAHLSQVERTLADAAGPDAMALRARTLSLSRDYAAAAGLYCTLTASHPDVLPWRLAGAQAYALSGRGAEASALLAPVAPDGLSPRLRVFHRKIASLAAMAAGDADGALEAARRAVDEALRLGEPEQETEAYQNLIGIHYRRGEIAEALRLADLAVAAGDRGRSLRWRYEARQFRIALRVLDDRPVSQAELDALASVARSTGDIYREGSVALIFANERYRRLDLEGAIAHRLRALALLERSGDAYGIDTVLQSLFALERLRGEREAALGALEQLEARRVGNTLDMWQLEFEFARGEIWTGRLAAASARLRRALHADGAQAQPALGRASLHCLLGQAQTLAGDASAALASLAACTEASAPPERRGADGAGGSTDAGGMERAVLRARATAWRAMTAGRLGRDEEVARHLRDAETLLRPTRDYRTLEALGELALAAGLVGDPAQAGPILAWIAAREEATAAALPRAMLRRGQCALSRRGGIGGGSLQCVEAEAAAFRIEHPMLRLAHAAP